MQCFVVNEIFSISKLIFIKRIYILLDNFALLRNVFGMILFCIVMFLLYIHTDIKIYRYYQLFGTSVAEHLVILLIEILSDKKARVNAKDACFKLYILISLKMFALSRNLCADTFLIIYLKIITILVKTTVKKKVLNICLLSDK